MNQVTIAVRMAVVTLILTGILYPLAMTGVAQLLFPYQANGSLVPDGSGQTVGSALIGQVFKNPGYFHSRPSAAGDGYDPTQSGGSNFGPTSAKLKDRMTADAAHLRAENPNAPLDGIGQPAPIPADLLTASGSGLDPHITPDAAYWQVPRVALARGVTEDRIRALLGPKIEERTFGLLGERRVNVLALNLRLDQELGKPASSPK